MESRTTNKSLWDHNIEYRDNGAITIGTFLRNVAPKRIKNLMSGDVPMVETRFPVIVMKRPNLFPTVEIDYQIQGNNGLAFVKNSIQLTVNRTVPEETTCSGLFCDKQRIQE